MGLPAAAHAQDDTYQVKAVSVDVSGDSALDARNKAFAEARRKAYEKLADKLLPPADRTNLVIPDDKVLASMVRDFEIVNEKMTSRRYAGTLDIRFTPSAVKRTMRVSAGPTPAAQNTEQTANAGRQSPEAPASRAIVPAAASAGAQDYVYSPRSSQRAESASIPKKAAARRALVLPWYGLMGRQTLWGPGNAWRAAWEKDRALARNAQMQIVLPVGDVDDVRDYSPPQPLSRRGDIDSLLRRYRATDAVLAMAEPTQNGGLVVSLYHYENGSPVPMGRFGVDGGDNTMADAVSKASAALRAMPENVSQPAPVSMTGPAVQPLHMPARAPDPVTGSYRTMARFSGLQQWVAMRQSLSRVPGVGMVDIRSISPSQANVEFTYSGDYGALSALLAQNNLQLTPLPAGAVTTGGPAAAMPQYLLTMGRGF